MAGAAARRFMEGEKMSAGTDALGVARRGRYMAGQRWPGAFTLAVANRSSADERFAEA
jgi:hypothetical protein